ncbi:MAG: Ig-like domain-containing protein, partial [Calditrichota bacterium]
MYNTFAVPSGYQLTRLGPAGHGLNGIMLNGSEIIGTSATATMTVGDNNAWDDAAITAFADRNLNHYFTASSGQGDDICLNFNAVNGTGGVSETDAQIQTLFYDPPLPSNTDGIIAVTERGGNNCLYIRFYGEPVGGGPEEVLGDTFIRTNNDYRNGDVAPPVAGSDYWNSGRENENSQNVAIALFELNSVAPTGSKISRVEFLAASNDHGDGKLFVLQRYAQPQTGLGCIDEPTFNGQIDNSSTVPAGATYTLESGPTPAGQSFTLNTDGSYTYVSTPGFTGDVVFEYRVTLPPPNDNISDTNTVTLTYNPLPESPTLDVVCNADGTYNITITNPIGSQYEYNADIFNGGAYQASPLFANLGPGTYNFGIRDLLTGCENRPSTTSVTLETFEASVETTTNVDCFGEATGSVDITVTGGFPPYSFLWSNGATTEDLTNVPAGSYNVQISDTTGCTFEFASAIVIDGPAANLGATSSIVDVLCFGEATGSIDLTVSGGTPGYTFAWSNGATTEDISGLAAGDYTVTITDVNDCTIT